MQTLKQAILTSSSVPYVYSYPPTRTYRPTQKFSLKDPVFSECINIYIHIPFCEQKCTFCGYLTTVTRSETFQDSYVDCLVKEIGMFRGVISNKTITSVNFGGGTPSLLTTKQFQKIMNALLEANPLLLETAQEISIEATPESIILGKIKNWIALGLNRASIGIQTFDNQEIKLSKRHNSTAVSLKALEILKKSGVANVCCDLMYGLTGQTEESWLRSVNDLKEFQPETIELYSLVVIPGTPLALSGSQMSSEEKLSCYELARTVLLEAGYIHDCHLRFIIPGKGFYFQQANVFQGQSLLGFGAGARSYTVNMHYRNIHNSSASRQAVTNYMQEINAGNLAVASRVMITPEEEMRRYVIYNIEHLDKNDFEQRYDTRFEDQFFQEYSELLNLGLAHDSDNVIELTPKGLAFRDVVAHQFFSKEVGSEEARYYASNPTISPRV